MRTLVIVLVLLVVAWFVKAGWCRARFVHSPAAFRCAIRASGGRGHPFRPRPHPRSAARFRPMLDRVPGMRWPRPSGRWPRRQTWARWEQHALVVRRGLLLPRDVLLPVRECAGEVRTVQTGGTRFFRRWSLAAEFALSDGSRVCVAAAHRDRLALVGPYLAAALSGLPPAPARHWRGRRAQP